MREALCFARIMTLLALVEQSQAGHYRYVSQLLSIIPYAFNLVWLANYYRERAIDNGKW